jgi:5-methylcytosine-specific restriction endonuclease McrA
MVKRTYAKDYHSLYDLREWKRLRHKQLFKEPLCRFCSTDDHPVAADVADHIKPHKGQLDLFLDGENLQSLCKHCHDSAKARIESKGYHNKVDPLTGKPTDPNHPSRRQLGR